ncbi:MAG: acetylserotonin O-methyltransferase [Betaproteobacteria bacterium]|nr:acetylserotonin O-methyltransferase [Betaproteobacteria bacterium]
MSAATRAARPKRALSLLDLIGANWTTQALATAAELGLADRLARGPARTADLADELGCDADSLGRLLRALASIGVCAPRTQGRYALAPAGEPLREDAPDSVRSWAIWCGRESWAVWGDLAGSVRTGRSVRQRAGARAGYAHLEDDRAARLFHGAMAELTRQVGRAVARTIDLRGTAHVVDVGGGYGELLAELLAAHPRLRGTVFDLPHATRGAVERIAQAGLAGRADVVSGSFFDAVPAGAEAYLMKAVLHNWDDDKALAILASCRRAMGPGSRLFVVERLLPARPSSSRRDRAILRSDLNMLVGHGGRERSRGDYAALLAKAGLRLAGVRPATLDFSVIEAVARRPPRGGAVKGLSGSPASTKAARAPAAR